MDLITHDINVLKCVSGTVALILIYYVASSIYLVFFHPLAKYPGPFFAKFSAWPAFYHTLGGDRHIWIWQCHQLYGPVFRYRPDGVLFNFPSAQRTIYESKANVQKGKFYAIWTRKADAINTWASINKTDHARKRRILNAAFSDRALKSAEPFIIRHVDRWCQRLLEGSEKDKGWSQPKNMADWSDYLVFDILGDLCYGRSFDTKEPGDSNLKLVPKFIHDYVTFMYPVAQSPFTNPWLWLKPRGLDRLLDWSLPKNVKSYFSFIEDCLKQRISEEKELQIGEVDPKDVRKDMFHYIFQSKDPETGNMGYRHEELFCESDLLIIAGSDTTSTIFAAMFFYMTRTRNADVYAKLTNEIRTTFTHVGEVYAGQRLNSCRYLRAFIDETLRMNPPVSSELNRETLSGGITINGHQIPKGINVGVSSWSLHHNEDIWPDPFQFMPERWIDGNSSMEIAKSRELDYTFSPFSNGAGGCPGKGLAYLEMTITMAKILLVADIRAVDDLGAGHAKAMWGRRNKTQFQTWDAFVATRNGPTVQLKARHT